MFVVYPPDYNLRGKNIILYPLYPPSPLDARRQGLNGQQAKFTS